VREGGAGGKKMRGEGRLTQSVKNVEFLHLDVVKSPKCAVGPTGSGFRAPPKEREASVELLACAAEVSGESCELLELSVVILPPLDIFLSQRLVHVLLGEKTVEDAVRMPYAAVNGKIDGDKHQAKQEPSHSCSANYRGVMADHLGKKNVSEKEEEGEQPEGRRYITKASKPNQTKNHRAESAASSCDAEIDTAVVALNHASKFVAERGEKSQRGEGERIGHLE